MIHKRFLVGVLAILVLVTAVGVSAFAQEAIAEQPLEIREFVTVQPGWQQVNSSGFGDSNAHEISALQAFNGYLYAGTYNPVIDARIFRSADGTSWTAVTDPGFGNSHDIAPPAILDMAVFDGKLYASTGRGNASQIWRSQNGTIWAPMDVTGFSDPENVAVTTLTDYGGKIYAGVTNNLTGAQIWSSFTGDNNSWSQVGPETPGSAPASVTALTVFSNTLYAAIEPESDAALQIWRSNGGDLWTTVTGDGFGDSNNTMTGGMAVFDGYLYLGGGNATTGAKLWRSSNGTNWTAVTPSFGGSNNQSVEMVTVFQNQLHISVRNSVTGIEIWRWTNSSLWEQINQDGFGDTNNTGTNLSNASDSFLGQFYVGTSNVVDGGELWRMQAPYGVDLSPDDSASGAAGQDLVYTLQITNTGTMTDTYDLAAAGNSWATAVSTSTLSLSPGASDHFSVTVSIPGGALGNDTDLATITATSQGDVTKSDATQLTSSVLPVYGLQLSGNQGKQGPAGWTVSYTLHITNTGNVADTFALQASGQTWTTTLSTPQINLGPGNSTSFTVEVAIPSGAADLAMDQVTITATSQGNSSKAQTAVLTTVSSGQVAKTYLPMIVAGLK